MNIPKDRELSDQKVTIQKLKMKGISLKPLKYLRKTWCPEADSNHRHADFQSAALPTELSGHLADLAPIKEDLANG